MDTHWTAWNGAPKAVAKFGKATFAMLVPREDNRTAADSGNSPPDRSDVPRVKYPGFVESVILDITAPVRSKMKHSTEGLYLAEDARFALNKCMRRYVWYTRKWPALI